MYSQQQSHIQELQLTIDRLEKQLREKENVITEKITLIREKERIVMETKTVVREQEEKVREIVKEKEEQEEIHEKTLVLQQRRIDQQDQANGRLQQKLDLQVSESKGEYIQLRFYVQKVNTVKFNMEMFAWGKSCVFHDFVFITKISPT